MSSRRSRGDGGLYWDRRRQRWVATATVGYDGRGKRLVRHSYGRTKTEAKAKLRDLTATEPGACRPAGTDEFSRPPRSAPV
jgi:hypothetical protein